MAVSKFAKFAKASEEGLEAEEDDALLAEGEGLAREGGVDTDAEAEVGRGLKGSAVTAAAAGGGTTRSANSCWLLDPVGLGRTEDFKGLFS